ncbi:MAG: hypothetical protein OXE86_19020 [Alphaproteobacteria bacterium]|nr:hypothetical protein [Alphaproteobacteria bacterium]
MLTAPAAASLRSDFADRLSVALGPGAEITLGESVSTLRGGQPRHDDVRIDLPPLAAEIRTLLETRSGLLDMRAVTMTAQPGRSWSARAAQLDFPSLRHLLPAVPGGVSTLAAAACAAAGQELRVELDGYRSVPEAAGAGVSAARVVLSATGLPATPREAAQAGTGCALVLSLDVSGLAWVSGAGDRLDLRGLTIAVRHDPGAAPDGAASVDLSVTDLVVTRRDGALRPVAISRMTAQGAVPAARVDGLIGFFLRGSRPSAPGWADLWTPGPASIIGHGIALPPETVFGSALAGIWRTATGRTSVDFNLQVARSPAAGGIRLHATIDSRGLGALAAGAVFSPLRDGAGPAVLTADLLARDHGLAGVLARLEAGTVQAFLAARIRATAPEFFAAVQADGLLRAIGEATDWISASQDRWMQVALRPPDPVALGSIPASLARPAPQRARILGVHHGPARP